LHAFASGCIPIYWGDPTESLQSAGRIADQALADFNPAALISAHDFESPDVLIRHIERVDQDPDLFRSYLRQPILAEVWYNRLRDWPKFCQDLTDLLFKDADRGTPSLPPPAAGQRRS